MRLFVERLNGLLLLTIGSGLLLLSGCTPNTQAPDASEPHVISGFDHYTFAVMWLPGVCATSAFDAAGCTDHARDADVNRQWTMHGLWASIPPELAQTGMQPPTWWKYGCYWFNADHASPKTDCENPQLALPEELQSRLDANMPMAKACLDRHEYFKHGICLGVSPDQFFPQALNLLDKLNGTAFTKWVRDHRGEMVSQSDMRAAFASSFGVADASSLELRCRSNSENTDTAPDVLTQAWITLKTDELAAFPDAGSLKTGRVGNCAANIRILN